MPFPPGNIFSDVALFISFIFTLFTSAIFNVELSWFESWVKQLAGVVGYEINELADCQLQSTLAISLHAPNHNLRAELMPIENKYPLNELKGALGNLSPTERDCFLIKQTIRSTVLSTKLFFINTPSNPTRLIS